MSISFILPETKKPSFVHTNKESLKITPPAHDKVATQIKIEIGILMGSLGASEDRLCQ
jgi:hypothetical protein